MNVAGLIFIENDEEKYTSIDFIHKHISLSWESHEKNNGNWYADNLILSIWIWLMWFGSSLLKKSEEKYTSVYATHKHISQKLHNATKVKATMES